MCQLPKRWKNTIVSSNRNGVRLACPVAPSIDDLYDCETMISLNSAT